MVWEAQHHANLPSRCHAQDATLSAHVNWLLSEVPYRSLCDVQVGFKRTGRTCTAPGCCGRLRDNTLDWEDALPERELKASEAAADAAGLALCLGTSLLVRPACNLPLRTVRKGDPAGLLARGDA